MWTTPDPNHEATTRIEAARAFLDHVLAGRCDPDLGVTAARNLLDQAQELHTLAPRLWRRRDHRRPKRPRRRH